MFVHFFYFFLNKKVPKAIKLLKAKSSALIKKKKSTYLIWVAKVLDNFFDNLIFSMMSIID